MTARTPGPLDLASGLRAIASDHDPELWPEAKEELRNAADALVALTAQRDELAEALREAARLLDLSVGCEGAGSDALVYDAQMRINASLLKVAK